MDLASQREQLLAHYIEYAREPGWRLYVWDRVNAMAREPHGMYADFPQRLTAALAPKEEKRDADAGS